MRTSIIATLLNLHIGRFVTDHSLGFVSGKRGGFQLTHNPDTVVAPNLAFVKIENIPAAYDYDAYFPGPPDLAVEIASSTYTAADILRKLAIYVAAGVRVVWVVNPEQRVVTVHTPGAPPRTYGEGEQLTVGELIPGFELPVAEIFRLPNR
jgi:Uma2 family endonuclease